MTVTLVSQSLVHNTTDWDPNEPAVWVFTTDAAGGWDLGSTVFSSTVFAFPDWPIYLGSAGSSWDATMDVAGNQLTVSIIPTGGWQPSSDYGRDDFPSATLGHLTGWTVWDADADDNTDSNVIHFSTGTGSQIVAAATTLSPLAVGMGSIVYASAAADTVSIANFVATTRTQVHFNFGATTVNGVERPPIDGHLPNSITGYAGWFSFRIWLDPDVQVLRFGVRTYFSTATHAGNVRLTIGSTTVTVPRAQSDNGSETTGTCTAAAVASTGWVDCAVTYERTVGTSGDAYVRNIRLQDDVVLAADLPPPEND